MSNRGAKLIQIIRDLAAENPDFRYEFVRRSNGTEGCSYVHEGQPSCIVGQAMWRAGLIDASLERSMDNIAGFSSLYPGMKTLSESEVDWISAVQQYQDIGEAWAEAIRYADENGDDDDE
jgi:hypothetical protein